MMIHQPPPDPAEARPGNRSIRCPQWHVQAKLGGGACGTDSPKTTLMVQCAPRHRCVGSAWLARCEGRSAGETACWRGPAGGG